MAQVKVRVWKTKANDKETPFSAGWAAQINDSPVVFQTLADASCEEDQGIYSVASKVTHYGSFEAKYAGQDYDAYFMLEQISPNKEKLIDETKIEVRATSRNIRYYNFVSG